MKWTVSSHHQSALVNPKIPLSQPLQSLQSSSSAISLSLWGTRLFAKTERLSASGLTFLRHLYSVTLSILTSDRQWPSPATHGTDKSKTFAQLSKIPFSLLNHTDFSLYFYQMKNLQHNLTKDFSLQKRKNQAGNICLAQMGQATLPA